MRHEIMRKSISAMNGGLVPLCRVQKFPAVDSFKIDLSSLPSANRCFLFPESSDVSLGQFHRQLFCTSGSTSVRRPQMFDWLRLSEDFGHFVLRFPDRTNELFRCATNCCSIDCPRRERFLTCFSDNFVVLNHTDVKSYATSPCDMH